MIHKDYYNGVVACQGDDRPRAGLATSADWRHVTCRGCLERGHYGTWLDAAAAYHRLTGRIEALRIMCRSSYRLDRGESAAWLLDLPACGAADPGDASAAYRAALVLHRDLLGLKENAPQPKHRVELVTGYVARVLGAAGPELEAAAKLVVREREGTSLIVTERRNPALPDACIMHRTQVGRRVLTEEGAWPVVVALSCRDGYATLLVVTPIGGQAPAQEPQAAQEPQPQAVLQ